MNRAKVITSFLEHVEGLSRLPLISNQEMDELFGEAVTAAVMELDRFNRKEEICRYCQNRCCQAIACEFHAPQFSRCPIHDFRPVVCRLHFCHRFHIDNTGNSLVKELGDVFFDSLLAADRDGSAKVRLFDCPPLARTAPSLIKVAEPWVNAVREGSLNPERAERLIYREAVKYRSSDISTDVDIKVRS